MKHDASIMNRRTIILGYNYDISMSDRGFFIYFLLRYIHLPYYVLHLFFSFDLSFYDLLYIMISVLN